MYDVLITLLAITSTISISYTVIICKRIFAFSFFTLLFSYGGTNVLLKSIQELIPYL